MPGPAPKASDDRRRRNKPKSGDWVILTESFEGPIPRLPSVSGVRWLKETKDWWSTIWRSKMATQWTDADVPGLVQLAVLKNHFSKADELKVRMSLAVHIDRKEMQFGLCPQGRKNLRWVVTEADAQSAGIDVRHLASVSDIRVRAE